MILWTDCEWSLNGFSCVNGTHVLCNSVNCQQQCECFLKSKGHVGCKGCMPSCLVSGIIPQLSIKMTTKIKCAHDHHDLWVKGWIKCLTEDKKTSHYTSCLFSCLHVSNRQQSSTLLYLPWVGELRRCTILSKIHLVFFVCLCTSFKYFFLKGLWPARSWQRLY
jgi:hypothetical protein